MSTSNPNKKPRPTTMLLPDVGQSARRASHNALLRLFHHLSAPVYTCTVRPSETQRQLVVTGFILSAVSIVTSFFPICGILTAISSLLIGIYGRRQSPAFRIIATWTITLALIGLTLSLISITIGIMRK